MPLGKAGGKHCANGVILEGCLMEYVVLRCLEILVGLIAFAVINLKEHFGMRQAISFSLLFSVGFSLTSFQLRVTAARPGTVNFELDIQKEHTVRLSPDPAFLSVPDRSC